MAVHTLKSVLIIALFSLTITPTVAYAAPGDPVLDADERLFNILINKYRATNGRSPLPVSVALTKAAKWLSFDMATMNYFSHTDSLGRGITTRLAAFDYAYGTPKGENIAAGASTPALAFAQWFASPGHNATMLSPSYTVMGIGRAYSATSPYKWYWTTTFGGYADRIIGT